MYKKIGQHPGTRKLYADRLATQGMGETWATTWSRPTALPWMRASTR